MLRRLPTLDNIVAGIKLIELFDKALYPLKTKIQIVNQTLMLNFNNKL
jgi:hypothetical protein